MVLCMLAISVLWWRLADRRLSTLKYAPIWRALLAVFITAAIVFPIGANYLGSSLPPFLPAIGWMWHGFGAAFGVAWLMAFDLVHWIYTKRGRAKDRPVDLSRRHALTAVVPPLVAAGLAGVCMEEFGQFRTHERQLAVPGWPAELSGFSIAVVADVHTGPYTNQKMLDDIVARTNTIHNGGPADLVVLAGDLINTTLDDLPQALDMATALRGKLGTYAIMGNHDVMDSREDFIAGVRQAGIPLLLEQVETIHTPCGASVQLLGVDWGATDPLLWQSVQRVTRRRDPLLFPICLAHHPHSWEAARGLGLPLMLSGHTHGGQIMLTKDFGAGPLKFRYWSGVHRLDGSTLVISNGVGDWFPLRVNAPAELLKVVLRPA